MSVAGQDREAPERSLAESLAFRRGASWRNRIALAPLTNMQSHNDGTLGCDELKFLAMRARGGFGLVMTCAAAVQRSGVSFSGQLGIYADRHIEGLTRLAAAIRGRGAVSAVQLQHAGARAVPAISGEQAVSPYADQRRNVRALCGAEISALVADYVAAAVRCERAGIDGVELHGAHGYLLCQFLNTDRNSRDDGYGGSYLGRTRIFREIVAGIREATGEAFQVGVRLSPEKYSYSLNDAVQFASELLIDDRIDYVDMSLWDCFKLPDEPSEGYEGRLIDVFGALPRRPGTRLGVAGNIRSSQEARHCLERGADFVFFGRGAIVHHDIAQRVIDDPAFKTKAFPVSRSSLREQGVGPAFQTYLMNDWPDEFLE